MNKGLIISLIAGVYKVYDLVEMEIVSCKPRGNLKIKSLQPKVGDYVDYTKTLDQQGIIEKIKQRKNDLIRPSICNIDQAFVIFSVKEPVLNLNLLDKFLVTLEYNQITPIIVFSKWDLLNEDETKTITKIIKYYDMIGYKTIITSTINNLTNDLKQYLKQHISVFTGQSGVGKSSLLNLINPDFVLRTNEISQALGRGKHTTRHVELLPMDGGWVADTPGFGTLDFGQMTEIDIAQNFVDFFTASKNCKYNGCLHLNEPGCQIKKLVNENRILSSRYENYVNFISDIRKDKKTYDSSTINSYSNRKGKR